jgi:hypothetical protein
MRHKLVKLLSEYAFAIFLYLTDRKLRVVVQHTYWNATEVGKRRIVTIAECFHVLRRICLNEQVIALR